MTNIHGIENRICCYYYKLECAVALHQILHVWRYWM